MDNQVKEKPQEETVEQQEEKKAKKHSKFLSASEYTFFLDKENLRKLFPMFFFIAGLGLFYIYNAHYAQRVVRRTDDVKDEIKELRAEYSTFAANKH